MSSSCNLKYDCMGCMGWVENYLKNFNERDRKFIRRFIQEARANSVRETTVGWYLGQLKNWKRIIKKDFDRVTKEDLKQYVATLNSMPYSDWTKSARLVAIKKFYQWLKGFSWDSEEYPERVGWIKIRSSRIRKEYIVLTEGDIERLIDSCKRLRNKTFIGVLFESGCRISEITNLRVDDIRWDEDGAILMVSGKTGQRPTRVIKYAGLLKRYLEDREDKSEWVWLTEWPRGRKMKTTGLRKVLDLAKQKSGITKPVHPHALRHARATQLARYCSDQEMRIIFGWSKNSPMTSLYSHLSHKDVDSKLVNIFRHRPMPEIMPKKYPKDEDELGYIG